MPKKHRRTEQDFVIESISGLMDVVKKHTDAGFDAIPTNIIYRRFHGLIKFLQDNDLTKGTLFNSLEDVTSESELRNSNLNDKGFYFLQYCLGKWYERLYKDKGEEKEFGFLEKWLKVFEELN